MCSVNVLLFITLVNTTYDDALSRSAVRPYKVKAVYSYVWSPMQYKYYYCYNIIIVTILMLFSERKQKEGSFIWKVVTNKQNVKGVKFPVLWLFFVLFLLVGWRIKWIPRLLQQNWPSVPQESISHRPIDNQTPVVYPPLSSVSVHLPQEGRAR